MLLLPRATQTYLPLHHDVFITTLRHDDVMFISGGQYCGLHMLSSRSPVNVSETN